MEDWIFFIHELRQLQGKTDDLSPSKDLVDEVKANYHKYEYKAPYLSELIHFPGRKDDEVFAVLDITTMYASDLMDQFEPEHVEFLIRDQAQGLMFRHRKHFYPDRIVIACIAECRARLAIEIRKIEVLWTDRGRLFNKVRIRYVTPTNGNVARTLDEHPSNGCGPLCWATPVDIPGRKGDKILVPLDITIHDPDVDLREFEQRVRAIDEPGVEWATATDLGANNLLIACVVDDREKLRLMLESLSGLARSLKVDTLAMYSISHDSTAQ